MAALGIV